MPNTHQGTSIRRALEVLRTLGDEEATRAGGLGVTRLSELLGHDKSQISRALAVLAEEGLVERVPGGREYRLGWQIHVLASRAGQQRLVEAMAARLRELADELEESAFAAVRRGDESVIVVAEHPTRSVHVRGVVGYAAPLLATSAGRALLADEGRGEFRRLIEVTTLERRTPHTLIDADEIWRRTELERERGYFMSDGEYEVDLVAVAVPVRAADPRETVLASIAIAGPRHRMEDSIERIATLLAETGADLARSLAHAGEPAG